MANAKPVTINGHRYDSMSAADRALGLPKGTIDRRLRRGNLSANEAATIPTDRRGQPQNPSNIIGLVAPGLIDEWDYEKNPPKIDPYYLGAKGGIKYWWLCAKCNHSWSAVIKDRTKGSGCPNCHEEKRAENKLVITNPRLGSEWHVTKNRPTKFEDVYGGSNKKHWWKCLKGHKPFRQSPQARGNGHGCPLCGRLKNSDARRGKPFKSGNTVGKVAPHIIRQFHPTRNGESIDLENWAANSQIRVWWVCPFGHEWSASISDRTGGSGCPKCSNQTSLPEIVIYCEMKGLFKYVHGGPGGHQIKKHKVDVFIEDIETVIEYDGKRWHSPPYGSPAKDRNKTKMLNGLGYTVIRLRETPLKALSPNDIEVQGGLDPKVLTDVLAEQLLATSRLTKNQKAKLRLYLSASSLQREDEIHTLVSQLPAPPFEKSLEYLFPDVAKEWHESNLPILPRMVTHGSKRIVKWKCANCGHVWPASINNRTKIKDKAKGQGSGCPECAKKSVGAKISAAIKGAKRKGTEVRIGGKVFGSISEAAREYGLPLTAVKSRIASGWSMTRVFKSPLQEGAHKNGKKVRFRGKTFSTVAAFAREYGKDRKTVERRLRAGYSKADALFQPLNKPRTSKQRLK